MLTRRELVALAMAPFANGQQYRNYSRCLPDYLSSLAREAYERRNRALAAITTADAARRRQAWARDTFWKLTGGQPQRTPLNVHTAGAFERPGYRVEKLYYESQPGLYISANLYIPTATQPPFPGVLFQMGHSPNGKAAVPYQKCCQGLVKLGYLVLAFDPQGQGERIEYPKIESVDEEHSAVGRRLLLTGDTVTRLQTWDAVRSLDVLAAHPLVDPKRLASTGQSGGATLTMFLAAVDDRLACAAVSSGNTENLACAGYLPPGSTDDAEQDFVASGPAGFDRWDTLYPMAPKPLLILVSAKDSFGTYSPNYMTNGREEFEKLRRFYDVLGAPQKLEWGETPVPHALSHDMRLRIYRFFERTMKQSGRQVEEPEVRPEPDELLIVGLPAGRTPVKIAADRAASIQPDGRLPIDAKAAPGASASVLGRANGEGCTIEAVEVQSAPDVWLPGWVYVPAKPGPTVLIALDANGRNARWREGDVYHRLAAAGITVCAFDVRGVGDLTPPPGRNSNDEGYAWASLMLGEPLVAQRVTDILTLVAAMRPRGRRVVLSARNHLTVPALFAAALEPEIAEVYLMNPLVSYASLLEKDARPHPLSNWIPGVLSSIDLPQLRDRLGARVKEMDIVDLAG